jgi:hypothetical protein
MTVTAQDLFTVEIDGKLVQLRWNDELNRVSTDQLTRKIYAIDGVREAAYAFSENLLSIDVVEPFADVDEIARVVKNTANQVFTKTKPVLITTKVTSVSGNFGMVETDYRHTDSQLLRALEKLGLYEVYFQDDNYNIAFYTESGSAADLGQQLNEAINAFYSDKLPRRPLEYTLMDQPQGDRSRFSWQLNRQVPEEDARLKLIDELKRSVKGLIEVNFSGNGHILYGRAANSLFNRNKLAVEVITIVEEFFEAMDAQV